MTSLLDFSSSKVTLNQLSEIKEVLNYHSAAVYLEGQNVGYSTAAEHEIFMKDPSQQLIKILPWWLHGKVKADVENV